jgi:hypothetical protein
VRGAAACTRFLLGAALKLCGWLYLVRFLIRSVDRADATVEMFAAFENPSPILGLGAAFMLPALALWALGHLLQRWRRRR